MLPTLSISGIASTLDRCKNVVEHHLPKVHCPRCFHKRDAGLRLHANRTVGGVFGDMPPTSILGEIAADTADNVCGMIGMCRCPVGVPM
jgi:hypothetical protein